MPSESIINTGEVIEGNDWFLTYRLVRADGVVVSQTDVEDHTSGDDALVVNVYELGTGAAVSDTAVYTATVVGGAEAIDKNVMASLKTDGFWNGVDSTGYNFFYRVPSGTWMKGGNRYKIEFVLALTSTLPGTDHGEDIPFGDIAWASIIYVKPMVS